jgi:hypothetical protein
MSNPRPLLVLAGAAAIAAASPAPGAVAAPIPPGEYAVQSTGGPVRVGAASPFELALPSGTLGTVTVAGADAVPVSVSGSSLAMPASTLTTPLGPATVAPAPAGDITGTLQPATGDLALRVPYTTTATSLPPLPPFTCSVGSAAAPAVLNLATTSNAGAAWDAASGAMRLADTTFVVPGVSACTGIDAALVNLATGLPTTQGASQALLGLTLTRVGGPAATSAPSGVPQAGLPPAGAAPVVPSLAIARRSVTVREGAALIRLTCVRAPRACAGTLTLRSRRRGGRAVTLGRAPFSIPAGRSAQARVRLSRAARATLRRRRTLPVTASATVTGARRAVTRALTLRRS